MTEIEMLVGIPGSGKSHYVSKRANGQVVLSRDVEGGTLLDLVPKVEKAISQGAERIVLDCTFVTREQRAPFLALAQRLEVPLHGTDFGGSKEQIQFNLCWRMVQRYGKVLRTREDYKAHKKDPNMFPPSVMFGMFKKYEKPDKSEGFTSLSFLTCPSWKLPSEFKNEAVMLDYDGTVRVTKSGKKYPSDPSDIEVFPSAASKLQALAAEGVLLLGASNQSGVAKNNPPMAVCEECFTETNRLLGVDVQVDFDYSPAGPIVSWHRKPMPGMGVDAIWKHKLDPNLVTYVGDMTTDRTFAKRCGFKFEWAKDFFGL